MDNNLKLRIDALQSELHSYYPLPEEIQDKIDKKFRLEFNYNSNHIEGNTLTYGETELFLFFDEVSQGHTGREYDEMRASDVALKLIAEQARNKEQPLTETFIKQLNNIILVRPYWKDAITADGQPTRREITVGDYKKFPNSVRLQNGEIFHYASPLDTPAQMTDMVSWFSEEMEKRELHPVELAALLHYRFVRIHPFDDGNGRISRLIMNYVLLYNDFPPVVIKSADKRNYLAALHNADVGNLEAFVNYIGEQLVWSLEISIKAARGESIEETDDVEKEIEVYKKKFAGVPDTLKKSDKLIIDLYDRSFEILLNTLKEKFNQSFSELFDKYILTEIVNNKPYNATISNYISTRKNKLKELALNSSTYNISGINSLGVDISLRAFKKGQGKVFNLNSRLLILFEQRKYMIKCNDDILCTKLYSQQLTKEEEKEIIKICLRNTFEKIKQYDNN